MVCNNCGNEKAYRMRFSASGESCDCCGGLSSVYVPDVFFKKPYLDPHLIDTKKMDQKDGVWISSRAEKAALMRSLGVREVGDRWHGGRNELRPGRA